MSELRYGLIGCGRIALNHIAAALENKIEIVAVCDLMSEKMEHIIDKFGLEGVNKYYSYEEMIQEEKLDLVAIATESGTHAQIAINSIKLKCNVIIEKPIALSLQDANEIIMCAEENKVLVSVCHQNRFNRSIQKIREALEEGRFGTLYHGTAHVRWSRSEEYYKQAKWRGTWEQDGGALMNQCIHNIDLLRWMMGEEIVEVMAYTDNLAHDYIEAEDIGLAIIKFKNGSYGMIEGTTNVYSSNLEETLYIFGENGVAKAGGKSVNVIEEWRFKDEIYDSKSIKEIYNENPPNVYGYGHTPLYRDMKDSIKNNREPYISGEDGKRALELVLAIYKSAKEGKNIKLPLESGSSEEFKIDYNY